MISLPVRYREKTGNMVQTFQGDVLARQGEIESCDGLGLQIHPLIGIKFSNTGKIILSTVVPQKRADFRIV